MAMTLDDYMLLPDDEQVRQVENAIASEFFNDAERCCASSPPRGRRGGGRVQCAPSWRSEAPPARPPTVLSAADSASAARVERLEADLAAAQTAARGLAQCCEELRAERTSLRADLAAAYKRIEELGAQR